MKSCMKKCLNENIACDNKACKFWIDFEEDVNCSLVSIEKHGWLTLKQVGSRLHLSAVRIKQIQDGALKKIKDNIL